MFHQFSVYKCLDLFISKTFSDMFLILIGLQLFFLLLSVVSILQINNMN